MGASVYITQEIGGKGHVLRKQLISGLCLTYHKNVVYVADGEVGKLHEKLVLIGVGGGCLSGQP